jgi:hypothetical protein
MGISGLHILLTYRCNYECDHCFVWGSPNQSGTFSLKNLDNVLNQAAATKGIEKIYFEGGEPFLYFPILVEAVTKAKSLGFWMGIVTNGYWATDEKDAQIWLKPLKTAGLDALEVSCDTFHGQSSEAVDGLGSLAAAEVLDLDTCSIVVDPPLKARDPKQSIPGDTLVGGDVMFRGRAAEKLVSDLPGQPWATFDKCPYENLENPSRIHLDPLGNLHICQGILMGNLFKRPLHEIVDDYEAQSHPVLGPLVSGGPAALVEKYSVPVDHEYVDACHLCYSARVALRPELATALGPDQMYGVVG